MCPLRRASSSAPGVSDGQRLVGAERDRVGAHCERIGRHRRPEAEVGRPGVVADERNPALVADVGDRRDVGEDADVGRLGEDRRADTRLGIERLGDPRGRSAERDPEVFRDIRREPHRPRAGQDQAGVHRLVAGAVDEHGLARCGRRQAQRLIGVGRAVVREPAHVGAPRRRRELLGPLEDPRLVAQGLGATMKRHVGEQQRRVADERRVALVAGGRERERNVAQVGGDGVGEGGLGHRASVRDRLRRAGPTRDDRRRCRTRSPSSSTRPLRRCPTRCGSWPAMSRSPTPRRVSGPGGRRRRSASWAPAAATWCSRRCAALRTTCSRGSPPRIRARSSSPRTRAARRPSWRG